jgi:hypothetical protein
MENTRTSREQMVRSLYAAYIEGRKESPGRC